MNARRRYECYMNYWICKNSSSSSSSLLESLAQKRDQLITIHVGIPKKRQPAALAWRKSWARLCTTGHADLWISWRTLFRWTRSVGLYRQPNIRNLSQSRFSDNYSVLHNFVSCHPLIAPLYLLSRTKSHSRPIGLTGCISIWNDMKYLQHISYRRTPTKEGPRMIYRIAPFPFSDGL